MSAPVGLIVNPSAGRDIRRLIGAASLVPHHEKVAVVRRVLLGLAAAGVEQVLYMGKRVGIVGAALESLKLDMSVEPLAMRPQGGAKDSTEAARRLADAGAAVLVTLGGDGTNRAVVAGTRDVPLLPISTGTNNVFPSMLEGTVAGLAAGILARGDLDLDAVAPRSKMIELRCGGTADIALIDVAVSVDTFRGAAALWDPARIRAMVLSRAEPWAVGLSSVGSRVRPVTAAEPVGLYVELGGGGRTVKAVIAPGLVMDVPVRRCRVLQLDEMVELPFRNGMVALDGERELAVDVPIRARVAHTGPRVVDVRRVMEASAA